MNTLSERTDSLVQMFDSFCVTVIRNFGRNLKRAAENRKKHDSTGEGVAEHLIERLRYEDIYEVEQLLIFSDGLSCVVKDERLYEVLLSLPNRQRSVIIYNFWGELTDREISKKLEVSVRTVYNLRQRAFQKIRTFYEIHS